MKVTYPGHPFFGQKLEVIRLCKGHNPDLIVRLPDGICTTIANRFTDYFAPIPLDTENQANPALSEEEENPHENENASPPLPLLELKGLLQLVHFIEQHSLRNRNRTSVPDSDPKQALQTPPLLEPAQSNAPSLSLSQTDSTDLHQRNMLKVEPVSEGLLPQEDFDPG